jgi:hypothetical protein
MRLIVASKQVRRVLVNPVLEIYTVAKGRCAHKGLR